MNQVSNNPLFIKGLQLLNFVDNVGNFHCKITLRRKEMISKVS